MPKHLSGLTWLLGIIIARILVFPTNIIEKLMLT